MTQSNIYVQKTILQFLEKANAINDIKKQCDIFRTLEEPACHFHVAVEASELLELDATLGNLILNNPTGASKLFQQVVHSLIESMGLCSVSLTQVLVVFKLQSLPHLPSYEIRRSAEFLRHAKSKRFTQYRGVVCGLTTPHKYTKSARFVCGESKCEGAEGNHFVRVHIPGALETQTIRAGFCCSFCGSGLVEDVQRRVLADKLIVELIDEEAFHSEEARHRHQSLITYLRDELASGIEIGQILHVIGLPILDVNNRVMALEANHMLQSSVTEAGEPQIPQQVAAILKDREASAWSFPLSLAYALGSSVTPPATFLHLKLGLLLSLTKQGGGIDVLAVSSDGGEIVSRLLMLAGSLSARCVVHGAAGSSILTASCSKDTTSGEPLIHGGSLLLAHSGVCVIPHLTDTLKKSALLLLLQAVDRHSVSVDVKSSSMGSIHLKHHCSVWASWQPSNQPADTLPMLADAFRMIYPADVGTGTYAEHIITQHTLLSAMEAPQPVIQHQHIQQFLCAVRSRADPELSEAAERLIKGYYVASRRVRGSSSNIPITAVTTISSMSVAHAKLCLRHVVLATDAAAAILLYEESITAISGHSVLNVQPLVHMKDENIEAHIGEANDHSMLRFLQHLQLFIANHADLQDNSYTADDIPEE